MCLDVAELAEAATTGDVDAHVADCLVCRRALDDERTGRALARRLPVPVLAQRRRREMAAELLAMAGRRGAAPATPPRRWRIAAMSVAAAAAAVALAWRMPVRAPVPVHLELALALAEPPASPRGEVAWEGVPAPLPAAQIEASDARASHRIEADRDVLTVADGEVAVDARSARMVDVRVGDALVHVDDASVRIRARGGAIVSVQVIVGSAQLVAPDRRVTLHRDTVWVAEPSAKQGAVSAFADAWLALRAGRNRDAIALFDRASDPAVAEEAAYWAAIAAERAGDHDLAQQRFAAFVTRFPASPYAAQARAALGGK